MPELDADQVPESGSLDSGSVPSRPAPGGWTCSECGHEAKSEQGLKVHWTRKHKGLPFPSFVEPPPAPTIRLSPPPAPELTKQEIEDLRRDLTDSIRTLSGFVFLVGAHVTALTIENRAERISNLAIAYATKNPAAVKAIRTFTAAMAASEPATIVMDIATAFAVDLGVLRPDREIHVGPIRAPGIVLMQAVATEVNQLAQLQAQAQAQAAQTAQAAQQAAEVA